VPDDDLKPEGVFYNMEAAYGRLFVLDANGGALLDVGLDGRVRTAVDIAKQFGQITPTALTAFGPFKLFANIYQLPIVDGASGLYVASPLGFAGQVLGGLTAVVDLAVDLRR
jgi:hypothetical protein